LKRFPLIAGFCLLVVLIAGLFAAPHGLQRTFYRDDTPTRRDTRGWLAFDGADYRAEDVVNGVNRISFEGYIWQPDAGTWRVVHTGNLVMQINSEIVLRVESQQALTADEVPVPAGWLRINAQYSTGTASYDAQQIEFSVYEQGWFGQWRMLPTHRLYPDPAPPELVQRETRIALLTRLAVIGIAASLIIFALRKLEFASRWLWMLAAVISIAWILRYVVLLQRSMDDPFFYYLIPGSDNYVLMARETLMGNSHLGGAFFSPGNTIWMIVLTTLFGYSLSTLYLVNMTVCAISIGFIAQIGREIGGKWTGIIAGLFAATFPLLVFYQTTLQLEALLSALLPLALWRGIQALKRPAWRTSAVFGISIGLITLVRMTSAVVGIVYTLSLIFSKNRRLGHIVTYTSLTAFFALLTIAPQTLANISTDQFALVNTNGPDTFYWGINRDGNGADIVGEAWYLPPLRHMTYSEAALEDIRAYPVRTLELTLHKLGLLWSSTDIANNVDYQAQGLGASPLLNALSLRGIWGATALLAFGLTGVGLLLTEKSVMREIRALLAGSFGLWILATLAFTIFGRMRVPLWVMLCVFAALTVTHLIRYRLTRQLIVCGLIAVLLLVSARLFKSALPRKTFFTGDLPASATPLNTPLGDHLSLAGWSLLESRCEANGYVFLSLFWEADGQPASDHAVIIELHDESGSLIGQRKTTIGTVSYPHIGTSEWQPGAKLEEKYLLLLPEAAPKSLQAVIGLAGTPTREILSTLDCRHS
jgi:4-amino-4-deoxy-L-arabinose transferase-like glycosyltransferase